MANNSPKPSMDGVSLPENKPDNAKIDLADQDKPATDINPKNIQKPKSLRERLFGPSDKQADESEDNAEAEDTSTEEPFGEDLNSLQEDSESTGTAPAAGGWSDPERFVDKEADGQTPTESARGTGNDIQSQKPLDQVSATPEKAPSAAIPEKDLPGGKAVTTPNSTSTKDTSSTNSAAGSAAGQPTSAAAKNGGIAGRIGQAINAFRNRSKGTGSQAGGQKGSLQDKTKKAVEDVQKIKRLWAIIQYFGPAIGVALAVLLLALGIAVVFNLMTRSGGSFFEQTDPVADKDWLTKALIYSGDKNVKADIEKQFSDRTKEALAAVQVDDSVDQATKDKALEIEKKLNTYNDPATSTAKKAEIGKEISEMMKGLYNNYNACQDLFDNSFFVINDTDKKSYEEKGALANGAYINPAACRFLRFLQEKAEANKLVAGQLYITFQGQNNDCIKIAGGECKKTADGKNIYSDYYYGNALSITTRNNLSYENFSKAFQVDVIKETNFLKTNFAFPYKLVGFNNTQNLFQCKPYNKAITGEANGSKYLYASFQKCP